MAFFLIRLAMVAGAVYGTMELGVWESSRHTEELFEGAKREVSPFTKDLMNSFCCWRCEKCDQDVEVKPWRESMVDAWNESVKKTFNTLGVHVPKYFNRFSQDVQQGLDDLVNNSGECVFRFLLLTREFWCSFLKVSRTTKLRYEDRSRFGSF
uniref:MICOS complex subunit MIC13 n=1 Tax=Drosophila rhopaloa TaxID=1041015 RepID=A0A6P4E207_DRORH